MYMWAEHGPFGGHLFLDFVNTVDDDGKTRSMNAIPDWKEALEWGKLIKLLSSSEAARLSRSASGSAAASEYKRLIEFREAAWAELSGTAAGRSANDDTLGILSQTIRWALANSAFERHRLAFQWAPNREDLGLKLIRARLALALLELTTLPDISHLRECGRCTGLFLDHGRGRGRRWCRMKTCGNRAKVERFRSKP